MAYNKIPTMERGGDISYKEFDTGFKGQEIIERVIARANKFAGERRTPLEIAFFAAVLPQLTLQVTDESDASDFPAQVAGGHAHLAVFNGNETDAEHYDRNVRTLVIRRDRAGKWGIGYKAVSETAYGKKAHMPFAHFNKEYRQRLDDIVNTMRRKGMPGYEEAYKQQVEAGKDPTKEQDMIVSMLYHLSNHPETAHLVTAEDLAEAENLGDGAGLIIIDDNRGRAIYTILANGRFRTFDFPAQRAEEGFQLVKELQKRLHGKGQTKAPEADLIVHKIIHDDQSDFIMSHTPQQVQHVLFQKESPDDLQEEYRLTQRMASLGDEDFRLQYPAFSEARTKADAPAMLLKAINTMNAVHFNVGEGKLADAFEGYEVVIDLPDCPIDVVYNEGSLQIPVKLIEMMVAGKFPGRLADTALSLMQAFAWVHTDGATFSHNMARRGSVEGTSIDFDKKIGRYSRGGEEYNKRGHYDLLVQTLSSFWSLNNLIEGLKTGVYKQASADLSTIFSNIGRSLGKYFTDDAILDKNIARQAYLGGFTSVEYLAGSIGASTQEDITPEGILAELRKAVQNLDDCMKNNGLDQAVVNKAMEAVGRAAGNYAYIFEKFGIGRAQFIQLENGAFLKGFNKEAELPLLSQNIALIDELEQEMCKTREFLSEEELISSAAKKLTALLEKYFEHSPANLSERKKAIERFARSIAYILYADVLSRNIHEGESVLYQAREGSKDKWNVRVFIPEDDPAAHAEHIQTMYASHQAHASHVDAHTYATAA